MTNPWPLRALTMLTLVLGLLLGVAAPAYAHANLVSTDPAEGAVLTTAPGQVRFTFDEPVRGVPDGVQVYDPQGEPVAASATVKGAELHIVLSEQLGNGTTVISWRVVSTDGHPISGALTFSVGAPSATAATAAVTPPAVEPPLALTLARWFGYVGLLLAAGLVLFAALFLPAEPWARRARRRTTTVARAAAVVAAAAWLAMVPLGQLYLLGGGWRLLGEGSTWSSVPLTEYAVTAAVAGGTALAAARLRRVAAVAAATVAATAPALVGHTRGASPEVLVIGADALHLLAGSIWLGGLAGLALTLPGLSNHGAAAATVLARFSTAAAGVLAALVATGSLLAWRILGSWSSLVDTTYGQLLLIKIATVLAAIAIAGWNRWVLLPRLSRQVRSRPVVRAVTIEGAILLVALLLTGFLVDTSPENASAPKTVAAGTTTDTRTTTLGDIEVRATVTPLSRGPNTVTLRLTSPTGEPTEGVAPPVIRLSSDRATLGEVPLKQQSAGIYTAPVVLPAPGQWRMQVSLRVTEFANPVAELEFTVNG